MTVDPMSTFDGSMGVRADNHLGQSILRAQEATVGQRLRQAQRQAFANASMASADIYRAQAGMAAAPFPEDPRAARVVRAIDRAITYPPGLACVQGMAVIHNGPNGVEVLEAHSGQAARDRSLEMLNHRLQKEYYSEWVPIENRRPSRADADDDEMVWITNDLGRRITALWDGPIIRRTSRLPEYRAAYWMPKQAAPKPHPMPKYRDPVHADLANGGVAGEVRDRDSQAWHAATILAVLPLPESEDSDYRYIAQLGAATIWTPWTQARILDVPA